MPYKDPEKILEYSKEYNENHKEERKLYYENHKEEIKLYYENHKEERKLYNKEYKYNSKYVVLLHYSNYNKPQCYCCQESNPVFLGLDHINGNGTTHRKSINKYGSELYRFIIKNNFPPELENSLQVLCHNCNKSKWTGKLCIHKRKMDIIPSTTSYGKKDYKKKKHKCLVNYSKSNIPFCACCGETEEEFLGFDHINGGGRKHFKEIGSNDITRWIIKNNFPSILRVLCVNCNMATSHGRTCPHNNEKHLNIT